tara:strand:- start:1467 stop:2465 length:999 start_codon:yes stop_codon:yes gene_type:complete
MATTTVTASLVGNTAQQVANPTDWLTQVRDATSAAQASTLMADGVAGGVLFGVVRKDFGGTVIGGIIRTFFFFKDIDTAVSGGTITSATVKISGSGGGNNQGTAQDSIIVSASAWGGNGSTTTMATSDYSKLNFSAPYSSTKTGWSQTGQNSYTLTSDAISDMNADGYLNCVVINEPNDFDDVSANVGDLLQSAYNYRPNVGSDPGQIDVAPIELVLTYSAAATATNVSVTQSIEVSPGDLSAGTPVTYSISNPLQSSSYFTLETVSNANGFYDTNSPRNLQGTFTLGAGISNVVSDDYKAGVVVAPGGGNLVFTPTNNVTAATLLLRGTGA